MNIPANLTKLISTLAAVFTSILAELGVDAEALDRFTAKLNEKWLPAVDEELDA